jgi:hypothetical protein
VNNVKKSYRRKECLFLLRSGLNRILDVSVCYVRQQGGGITHM